jgi:hypothetical protein
MKEFLEAALISSGLLFVGYIFSRLLGMPGEMDMGAEETMQNMVMPVTSDNTTMPEMDHSKMKM